MIFSPAGWISAGNSPLENPCAAIAEFENYYRQDRSAEARRHLAILYNNCGIHYSNQNKWNTAERYLTKAKELAPEEKLIRQSLANVLAGRGFESFRNHQWREARLDLEKALRYDPQNPEIQLALSQVVYRLESGTDQTQKLVRDSLRQTGDLRLAEKAGQYEREVALEKTTKELKESNWVIRIPEGLSEVNTARIFDTIEKVTYEVGKDFQYWIKHPVVFVLVAEADFQNIHTGPGWAGALNDGRIKIPVTGRYQEDPRFREVVAHEYTHSVIEDLSYRNPVPFWLHEGLAEYEGYKAAGGKPDDPGHFPLLLAAMKTNSLIPMKVLADPAASQTLPPEIVALAYQQSLAFVLYIEDVYRFYSLLSMIKEIGKGRPVDEATVQGIGRNINFLDEEWRVWLGRKFPK